MTELVDYLVDKVNKTELCVSPWAHLRIDDFLPANIYSEMLDMHQAVKWEERWEEESSWETIKQSNSTFKALASDTLYQSIVSKFGVAAVPVDTKQSFKLDNETHKLQFPHRDSSICIMTMQIFLQPKCYLDGGTILMSSETEEVEELQLVANSCNIFLNTRKSWHTVKQRGYTRKSMVQRWRKIT